MDKSLEKIAGDLEVVLREMVEAQGRLLSELRGKRLLLRSGDREGLVAACERENGVLRRISELERARLELIGEATGLLADGAAKPLSLREIAERVGEPGRGRLLVLRERLRELIEVSRAEAAVAKRVSEALGRHMQGVVQTIGGMFSGTYGRPGRSQGVFAVSTFVTTA